MDCGIADALETKPCRAIFRIQAVANARRRVEKLCGGYIRRTRNPTRSAHGRTGVALGDRSVTRLARVTSGELRRNGAESRSSVQCISGERRKRQKDGT